MQTLEKLLLFGEDGMKFRDLHRYMNLKFSLANAFVFIEFEGTSVKYKERNNNPLLSKSTLNYRVCYQVFWVKVRCLQDQCIPMSALVFYYCISNKLPREKTVIKK